MIVLMRCFYVSALAVLAQRSWLERKAAGTLCRLPHAQTKLKARFDPARS